MDDRNRLDFKHFDITSRIVEVFFEVYGELGYGFLESVYRSAMGMALREAGLQVETEVEVQALFRGRPVGVFRLDFVVAQAVIVELKAARSIDHSHLAQVLNYLRCTSHEVGLILNVGPRPQIRRVAFTNSRKPLSTRKPSWLFRSSASSAFICGQFSCPPQMNADARKPSYTFTATGRVVASGVAWVSIRIP